MDSDGYLALIAVGIAATTLGKSLLGGSLTRGEHDEFKQSMIRELQELSQRLSRLEDKIHPPTSSADR